mgnify:CR=1 FL=1
MHWYWWALILVSILIPVGVAVWWFWLRVPRLPKLGKKFEVWYGRVNAWANDKRRLEKDVKACRKAGVKVKSVAELVDKLKNEAGVL